MPELGTYGSVRGALSNERPYRDSGAPQLTEGTKQTAAFKAAMQNGKICMAFAWQIQT
jgi:hypothetical protein